METPAINVIQDQNGPGEQVRKNLSILVVDDSKTARFAMRKYLERLSCRVDTAGNALEAYRFLADHRPDVIFLDNVMPGINGMEVLGELQSDSKTAVIPVIFCTSIDSEDFIFKALRSGAREVLHKPPTVDILSELLANIGTETCLPTPANSEQPAMGETRPEPASHISHADSAAGATYLRLQWQIDLALKRLKNELSVQLSELSSQIEAFESAEISDEELRMFRQIAREEAEALNQSLRAEMEAIHRRLDRIALRQFKAMQTSLNPAAD